MGRAKNRSKFLPGAYFHWLEASWLACQIFIVCIQCPLQRNSEKQELSKSKLNKKIPEIQVVKILNSKGAQIIYIKKKKIPLGSQHCFGSKARDFLAAGAHEPS